MSKTIGVVGFYWTNNYGDLLLRKILVDRLKAKFQDISANVIYIDEKVYKSKKNGISKLLYLASFGRKSDILIFGGGGYFESSSIGYSNIKYLAIFLLNSILNRMRGGVSYIYGVGVGPNVNFIGGVLIKCICSLAKEIIVRDEESRDLLEKLNINNVRVLIDGALIIGKNRNGAVESIENKKNVALHLLLRNGEYRKMESLLIDLINKFDQKTDIFLISDNGILGEERNLLNKTNRKIIVIEKNNLDQFTDALASMDMVVTTKLHVGIVSYSLRKKIFCIYRHEKCLRFYRQAKLLDNCAPIDSLTSETIRRIIKIYDKIGEEIYENKEIEEKRSENIAKSVKLYEAIDETISRRVNNL